MTTLTQIPEDESLLPLLPTWTISVLDIPAGALTRTLTVTRVSVGAIYSWVDGVVVTDPAYSSSYTYDGANLVVTLSLSAPAAQGESFLFNTTYTDTLTSEAVGSTYLTGEAVLLAQNPSDQQQDVAKNTSVLFSLSSAPPLQVSLLEMRVNNAVAFAPMTNFSRPDFEGTKILLPNLISLSVNSRRMYDENSRVFVEVDLQFSNGVTDVYETYAWNFTTTYERTTVTSATIQNAPVDRPSPKGIIEAFRSAAMSGMKPEGSSAPFAVILFYAVQQSGLSSLAPYLPGASLLAPEVSRLRARDLVAPQTAYESLIPVAPFFEAFVRELVAAGFILAEEAELLLRAWAAEDAADRLAAVAAALLYGFPLA